MRKNKLSRPLTLTLAMFALILFLAASAAAQTEKVLYSFKNNGKDGNYPYSALIFDPALGYLYGTTSAGGSHAGGSVFELVPQAGGGWGEKVIYNFNATATDGGTPIAGLILDGSGNLYGVTYNGGAYGFGTVFELVRRAGGHWAEVILHSFNNNGVDGANPNGGLLLDGAGILYGTTAYGGGTGAGTVFELSRDPGGGWSEEILYSFLTGDVDGNNPMASLIFDSAGNLYGTTLNGSIFNCENGCGTVFELSPSSGGQWTETLLHSFHTCFGSCGLWPEGGLVFDTNGNLFFVTTQGGNMGSCGSGCGTVSEMSPAGDGTWTEMGLYNFTGGSDGAKPAFVTPIFDAAGNLYGTTTGGGANSVGAVFELSPQAGGTWSETVLHSFSNNGTDGQTPSSSLVMDSHGFLYGTTAYGGAEGVGTVFEIRP